MANPWMARLLLWGPAILINTWGIYTQHHYYTGGAEMRREGQQALKRAMQIHDKTEEVSRAVKRQQEQVDADLDWAIRLEDLAKKTCGGRAPKAL